MSDWIDLPQEGGGGGGGAVSDVNGITGGVNIVAGTGISVANFGQNITITNTGALSFPIIAPGGSVGAPSYAFSESGNDTGMWSSGDGVISFSTNGIENMTLNGPNLTVIGDINAANYPPTGNNNAVAGYDGSGVLYSIPGFNIDTTSGGLSESLTENPNNNSGGFNVNSIGVNFDPLQNSPNETWNVNSIGANLDTASSGFTFGTGGNALNLNNNYINHNGTGDVGGLAITNNYFGLGNGTDPIDIKGFSYSYGFGNINANVNISGPTQGYGFQPSFNAASTLSTNNTDVRAFYDFCNMPITTYGYQSYSAGPAIATIANNHNYVGVSLNPNITTLQGNAGLFGIAMSPQIGTIGDQGSFQGININPTVTLNNAYAVGLDINMNNVTNFAGVAASLVVQDITYTFNQVGTDGNNYSIEYTDTTTAGNEVATLLGQAITVTIQSGVSTATQVAAAIAANLTISGGLTTVITGVASNPQVTYAATNLAGGINPGTSRAINVTGDVNINGALSFTGGLSIGALQSYGPQDLSLFPTGVQSVSTLITAPFTNANDVITGVDLLGVNTAMLLTMGDNSSITSSFLGIAALGLPAVVSMGTGATLDLVEGAVFAVSLDGGAAGGTIDEMQLCRALTLPNGVTTVTKLKGYAFDLPFGDPATTSWGFYAEAAVHNYFAGDLVVGGTPDTADTPANASVGIELNSTTKAILNARMTTTEKNALTAVAGMMVYDSTLNQLSYYNGSVWVNV